MNRHDEGEAEWKPGDEIDLGDLSDVPSTVEYDGKVYLLFISGNEDMVRIAHYQNDEDDEVTLS